MQILSAPRHHHESRLEILIVARLLKTSMARRSSAETKACASRPTFHPHTPAYRIAMVEDKAFKPVFIGGKGGTRTLRRAESDQQVADNI
jgi:hypothetical protein